MTSATLADSYQPLMTRLVQESLVKLCVENLPITDTSLQIDGIICISLGKDVCSQIVVKVHKFLEKETWQGALADHRLGDSNSPWSLKKGDLNSHDIDEDGAVDLTGARQQQLRESRSILQYTSENMPSGRVNNNIKQQQHGATTESAVLVNGGRVLEQELGNSAIYKGPIPVPQVGEEEQPGGWKPAMLNKLSQLQPTNYKPLPHLKLKSPVKTSNDASLLATPDKTPKDLPCKICSKICHGGLSALQAHTQQQHRRYVCRFCYNTFSLRCNLKRHERLHVGVKPYNCKVCNKSFARSTDLKLHMHKHGMSETDVVVPCPRCPRSFLSVQNLRWHLYKVHKETDATYACTICEKLFIDKDEYMKHREEHTVGDQTLAEQEGHFTDSLDGDSDNDQLFIDTQSEGTLDSGCMDDEIALPKFDQHQSMDSHSSNSNEPSDMISQANNASPVVKDMIMPITSTPMLSTASSSGSRKRKRGNPVKHVEEAIEEEDVDIDNMYYNSPMAKKQQAKEKAAEMELTIPMSEEPQDLSNKPMSREYRSITPSPAISPALSLKHGLETGPMTKGLQSFAMPAQGYINKPLSASWDSNTYRNLKGALTGTTQAALPGHRTPEPFQSHSSGSFSPLTLPILITPTPENKMKSTPKSVKSTPDTVKAELDTSIYDDPNKEFQCSELGCSEVYLGFSAYEDHCMIRHGRYPCKYCRQTFSGKNNRTRHMRCHVGAKVYTCPDCFKNFSRPDSMREHQFIHTLSYQEDKCRNCGWAFDKKNLLLAHLKQCYRHKMETGKSTKLIDETPAYLNNDVEFKPLYPVKMESIPVSSVDGSLAKGKLVVPTVVPTGSDSSTGVISNVVNSMLKQASSGPGVGEEYQLATTLSGGHVMSFSNAKSLLVPNVGPLNSNSIMPLALLKQSSERASLSPITSLPSSMTFTANRSSPLTVSSANRESLNKTIHTVQGLSNPVVPDRSSPLTVSSANKESLNKTIDTVQGLSNLVVPSLESLLPTPLIKPAAQKASRASPSFSEGTESVNSTNIGNLVVPNISSVFNTSLLKRASPDAIGSAAGSVSPIVIVPERSSPICTTSSLPLNSNGGPVVLSANAAAAAVTAVSTTDKNYSTSSLRSLSPNNGEKTSPPPTVPSVQAISQLNQVVVTEAATAATSGDGGYMTMPSLISPSASRENRGTPVNNVLAAVKNLVKARTSPTVIDQNANKTPSLQSNSEVE